MYVSVVVLISCCMSISMSCREKRCRVGAPLSRLFNCYYLLVKRDYVMRSSSKYATPQPIEDVRIWNQLSSLIWTVLIIWSAALEKFDRSFLSSWYLFWPAKKYLSTKLNLRENLSHDRKTTQTWDGTQYPVMDHFCSTFQLGYEWRG